MGLWWFLTQVGLVSGTKASWYLAIISSHTPIIKQSYNSLFTNKRLWAAGTSQFRNPFISPGGIWKPNKWIIRHLLGPLILKSRQNCFSLIPCGIPLESPNRKAHTIMILLTWPELLHSQNSGLPFAIHFDLLNALTSLKNKYSDFSLPTLPLFCP